MNGSKRFNVLFLTSWFPLKERPNFGIFVRDWAKAVNLRENVTVCHLFGADTGIKHLWVIDHEKDKSLAEGLAVYRVRYRKLSFPFSIFQYIVYVYAVIRTFQELSKNNRFDVIHCFILRAGFFGCILGALFRVPHLLTECFTNVQTRSLSIGERLRLAIIGKYCPLIIAISTPLRDALRTYGLKSQLEIIPCTTDTSRFSYSQSRREGPFRFLTLCNLFPRKGIDILLRAAATVKRNDFSVIVAGEGPERKNLEELSRELGIADRVRFYGFVDEHQKLELFKDADAFILPSYKENFGVVLIEALACGKPVIATFCGGPEDFVVPDVGILIPPGSVEHLCSAMGRMIAEKDTYDPEKISEYARENFSYNIISKNRYC